MEGVMAKAAASASADDSRRSLPPQRQAKNNERDNNQAIEQELKDAGVLPDKSKNKTVKAGSGAGDAVMVDPKDSRFSYVKGFVIMEGAAPPKECTFGSDCGCQSCEADHNDYVMSHPILKHPKEIKRKKCPTPGAESAKIIPTVVDEEIPERLKAS